MVSQVKEPLDLDAQVKCFVGVCQFHRMTPFIVADHLAATGTIMLNEL